MAPRTAVGQLYEVASGRLLAALPPAGRPLAFSPDGRLLACLAGSGPLEPESDRVVVLDVERGRQARELSGHRGPVTCAVFSPDGNRLFTGSIDHTILAWDVTRFNAPAPAPKRCSPNELDRHWLALAGADARAAAAAARALAADPDRAVPMLRARLRPVARIDAAAVDRHVRDLGDDAFAVRRAAEAALAALGERAAAALRRAEEEGPDLEASLRAARLLGRIDHGPTPDRLRALRATTALERMGTVEARRLLAGLARGAAGALLTEEAAAALRRLDARGARP